MRRVDRNLERSDEVVSSRSCADSVDSVEVTSGRVSACDGSTDKQYLDESGRLDQSAVIGQVSEPKMHDPVVCIDE